MIWRYIKNEIYLILTLLGLLLMGLLCWLGSSMTEQFGLNFFTEILGVAVTVFIIDILIQKREENRNIPLKLAAYEDIRLYTSRYICFWTQTFRESVPEKDPETLQDFFSENGMTKILGYLYLDSEPSVSPPVKWWNWIIHNANEFKENGIRILDRYPQLLDPIAFGYLHQLTESLFNMTLLNISPIRQGDIIENFPRIQVLGNYAMKPRIEDYEAILGLVKWYEESYSRLKKHSPLIKEVIKYTPNKEKVMPPKSMIPQNILEKQIIDLKNYRQRNK